MNTEVRASEAISGTDVINRTTVIHRDRIAVSTDSDKSLIGREYPEEGGLKRLAEVAAIAVEETNRDDQKLRAIGYNMDFVYEPSPSLPAIQYLATKLFPHDLLQEGGRKLHGGAGRLYFEKDGRNWQSVLEARLNDSQTSKVFASMNLHIEEEHLSFPSQEEIEAFLKLIWEESLNLVNQLDGSNSS